ncbi:hypothetical protein CHU98_g7186 [Xylaria longipes]|nr:hypothetical protein CHU98_g7186 [Xylaria longipes]
MPIGPILEENPSCAISLTKGWHLSAPTPRPDLVRSPIVNGSGHSECDTGLTGVRGESSRGMAKDQYPPHDVCRILHAPEALPIDYVGLLRIGVGWRVDVVESRASRSREVVTPDKKTSNQHKEPSSIPHTPHQSPCLPVPAPPAPAMTARLALAAATKKIHTELRFLRRLHEDTTKPELEAATVVPLHPGEFTATDSLQLTEEMCCQASHSRSCGPLAVITLPLRVHPSSYKQLARPVPVATGPRTVLLAGDTLSLVPHFILCGSDVAYVVVKLDNPIGRLDKDDM